MDVQPGFQPGADHHGLLPDDLNDAGFDRIEHRRHDGGNDAVVDILHLHAEGFHHVFDLHAILVGGADGVGGNAGFEQNFIIFNTADDQIGITDVNGKQHNDLSLTFFHPFRKVQQRLSDDGHQNGGNNSLRDSGRRDRPHHKSKNGGNGHVFRLCVLLGK